MLVSDFISFIPKDISFSLYIFIDGNIPSNTQLLSVLYDDYKNKDGFLYMIYDIENTFGSDYYFKKVPSCFRIPLKNNNYLFPIFYNYK